MTLSVASPLAVAPKDFAPWPLFEEDEIQAVTEVLRSGHVNYWTGTIGRKFEEEFAQYVGTRHAIALANGTLALELALYALEIGPGDEVIVPSRTFVATASAVAARGARAVFAEVDCHSQNITAETIRPLITPKTKAIIVVHLAGWPCEMDSIMQLAKQHGLKVIEDCAQAHGATYQGQQVGSIGDIGAFSFCQDKIMTTGGEGGMITLNDSALWERAWSYKDHGKSWDAVYHRKHDSVFKWLHESLGTNWRLTEMQSAIGRIALQKLPSWLDQRRANSAILYAALQDIPGLRLPVPGSEYGHSYYKFYAFVRPELLAPGWSRDQIITQLQSHGLLCGTGTCPEIYLEKAFDSTGWAPERSYPIAQELGETSLMFVVHPTLSTAEMETMAALIREVCQQALLTQAS